MSFKTGQVSLSFFHNHVHASSDVDVMSYMQRGLSLLHPQIEAEYPRLHQVTIGNFDQKV